MTYQKSFGDHNVDITAGHESYDRSISDLNGLKYDAIVIGTKHNEYKKIIFKSYLNKSAVIVDIHGVSIYSENVIL